MKEYIRFISRTLWACFFMAFLGWLGLYLLDYHLYILGWLWGIITMMAYTILLGVQYRKLMMAPTETIATQSGKQVLQRLLLIVAMVGIGAKVPSINLISLGAAIVLMQPLLFIMYWRLGKQSMDSKIET